MTQLAFPSSEIAAFAAVSDIQTAELYTRQLTKSHYENFSVISLLLPKHLKQDFCNVYAFCRTADDLGDEIKNPHQALDCLERFKQQTRACYAGSVHTAVFVALSETIKRHSIPIEPFIDLIDAFEQDQRITRYDTFAQLLDYCRRSADPVGRLVLYMSGYRDEERQKLSDKTCSALQLANFWQDVRRDKLDLNRIYIPRESMQQFGVLEDQIAQFRFDDNFRKMMEFEVQRTESMFDEGAKLLPMLNSQIRPQISLFTQGGRAILQAIRNQNFDTLTSRPSLSKWQKGRLVSAAFARYIVSSLGFGGNR